MNGQSEPTLPSDAEVVVVGGGIAGTSTAFHLAEAGVDVLLFERGEIGGGATGAAVGVLSPPLRQPFHETVHHRGQEEAAAIWRFAERSVRGIGETLRALDAAAEAELDLSGGWILAEPHTAHEVRASFEALRESDFDVEWFDGSAILERTQGHGFSGGFLLAGGGSFDPGGAARALAYGARARGARVIEGVEVGDVVRADGGGLRVDVGDERSVNARMVVYATHVESRRFSRLLGDEIVPIRGQGIALRLPRPFPANGSFATHWKLNVWRRSPDDAHELYLGGWRHDAWDRSYWKVRPEIDRRLQDELVEWFRQAFPGLGRPEVAHRWSGIFGWTADFLPLVGPLPGSPEEMVVGGFSGGGLPFAFESGRVIAHAVAGLDEVPGARLFDPRRFV